MRPLLILLSVPAWITAAEPVSTRSAADLWRDLLAGNQRYVHDQPGVQPKFSRLRHELAQGQHPGAIVLSCSDSRVPPEIIFDQGLGDLFVIRVAGNVPNDEVLGSIEYAVEHLGSKLVVVLGHERCGAVSAAVGGGEAEGHVAALVRDIGPVVAEAKAKGGDVVENAVRLNVSRVVRALEGSEPVLHRMVQEGKVKIIGARYDLESGQVEPIR